MHIETIQPFRKHGQLSEINSIASKAVYSEIVTAYIFDCLDWTALPMFPSNSFTHY